MVFQSSASPIKEDATVPEMAINGWIKRPTAKQSNNNIIRAVPPAYGKWKGQQSVGGRRAERRHRRKKDGGKNKQIKQIQAETFFCGEKN
jgi:hypothetical protein